MIRDKNGKKLTVMPEGGNAKCGNCLMERVDITELRDDGTCPVCNPRNIKRKPIKRKPGVTK